MIWLAKVALAVAGQSSLLPPFGKLLKPELLVERYLGKAVLVRRRRSAVLLTQL
jgi:hypothetical protein